MVISIYYVDDKKNPGKRVEDKKHGRPRCEKEHVLLVARLQHMYVKSGVVHRNLEMWKSKSKKKSGGITGQGVYIQIHFQARLFHD
jgi:hypothetical protein